MYERDHVHAKALSTKNGILFGQYRSLGNYFTEIINENKQKYYNEINSSPRAPEKNVVGNQKAGFK